MTDKNKFVGWDADWYKSLSDDECVICLTEQQVYLIGEVIRPLEWATRWLGDKSGLDLKGISGNLEQRIAERLTCQSVTDILNRLSNVERTVNNISNPAPDMDENSTIQDRYTDEQIDDMTVSTDGCDTPDKDALYGGISQLVRFINQNNIDALEQLSQIGNVADQVQRFISATPVGFLPFDEIVDYTEFIVDELLEEYNATSTEELLQTVICDLFCIAVDSGCRINITDVVDYFAGKVDGDFTALTMDLVNVVDFAFTGTFTGDKYFYYMCLFQMVCVAIFDHFFNMPNFEYYTLQIRSGMNTPDNDWTIFCTDCPEFFRIWTWDFQQGLGEWSQVQGTFGGGRVQGVDIGFRKELEVNIPIEAGWRIRSCNIYTERIDGIAHGTGDYVSAHWRVTAGTDIGSLAAMPNGGFLPNGVRVDCGYWNLSPGWFSGVVQLNVKAGVTDSASSKIFLDKIEILYEVDHSPLPSRIIEDDNLCL